MARLSAVFAAELAVQELLGKMIIPGEFDVDLIPQLFNLFAFLIYDAVLIKQLPIQLNVVLVEEK